MTTVFINEHTEKGKSLIEFLRKFEGEKFINFGYEPNDETKEAIFEAREGNLNSYKNTDELFASILNEPNVQD
jgi:hypothetical protein